MYSYSRTVGDWVRLMLHFLHAHGYVWLLVTCCFCTTGMIASGIFVVLFGILEYSCLLVLSTDANDETLWIFVTCFFS